MACIIRLRGKNFDPGPVAAALTLVPYKTWRQGEYLGRRQLSTSGLSFVVSEAGFDAFWQQVSDATTFIKAYKTDLRQLGALAPKLKEGEFYLDFGLFSRMGTVYAQVDVLPAELVKLCGEIEAGIILSQYPPSDDKDESN